MEPNTNGSAFKRAQVRHRRQGANPNRIDDLDQLIDFSIPEGDDRIIKLVLDNPPPGTFKGPLYGLDGFPGFLYASQALSPDLQLELAFQSVYEFCEAPHATNIDLVPPKPNEEVNPSRRMWDLWKTKSSDGEQKPYRSFQKLSWATSGYQYDWTARAYNEASKSPVPAILERASIPFAKASLFLEKDSELNFTASACIVNYYNEKSIMGGHRDDLELALDKPVISLSLGLPGVFLLGGKTKDHPVLPLLVRPGDVYILGGHCRMNYHGMARVIPVGVEVPDPGKPSGEVLVGDEATRIPEADKRFLQDFLRLHRININVRQVLPDGVGRIPETSNTEQSS